MEGFGLHSSPLFFRHKSTRKSFQVKDGDFNWRCPYISPQVTKYRPVEPACPIFASGNNYSIPLLRVCGKNKNYKD
jgi:hypothetical protein